MAQLQPGWKAGPEQYAPNELLDYAIVAEQSGFDTIDSSDHFNPWSEAGQASFVWTKLIELNVAYTDDTDAAIECQKKYWAGTFIPALFDQKIYTPKMSQENGKSVGSDTIMKMCCISSKAEDHIKYAQQFIDLGFTTLFFHSAGPDQRSFLERYGRDVLPQIRAKNGVQQQQQQQQSAAASGRQQS